MDWGFAVCTLAAFGLIFILDRMLYRLSVRCKQLDLEPAASKASARSTAPRDQRAQKSTFA